MKACAALALVLCGCSEDPYVHVEVVGPIDPNEELQVIFARPDGSVLEGPDAPVLGPDRTVAARLEAGGSVTLLRRRSSGGGASYGRDVFAGTRPGDHLVFDRGSSLAQPQECRCLATTPPVWDVATASVTWTQIDPGVPDVIYLSMNAINPPNLYGWTYIFDARVPLLAPGVNPMSMFMMVFDCGAQDFDDIREDVFRIAWSCTQP